MNYIVESEAISTCYYVLINYNDKLNKVRLEYYSMILMWLKVFRMTLLIRAIFIKPVNVNIYILIQSVVYRKRINSPWSNCTQKSTRKIVEISNYFSLSWHFTVHIYCNIKNKTLLFEAAQSSNKFHFNHTSYSYVIPIAGKITHLRSRTQVFQQHSTQNRIRLVYMENAKKKEKENTIQYS